MKVLYLAGPITNSSVWARKLNIDNALAVARQLWAKGYFVFCPHGNTYLMDGPEVPYGVFIAGSKEFLSRCDALVLLPGWADSKGCLEEYDHARRMDKPIYYWVPETSKLVLMDDLGGHDKAPRW